MFKKLTTITLILLLFFPVLFIPQKANAATTISITSPANGATVTSSSFTITGTATADRAIAITINGTSAGSTTSDGSGNWSLNVTGQSSGDKTIVATASTQTIYTNVANPGDISSAHMAKINSVTGAQFGSFSTISSGLPFLVWHPDSTFTKAYGTSPYLNSALVWVIDFGAETVSTFTMAGTTPRAASMAFNADNSKAYVVDNTNAVLHVYNTTTNAEIGSGINLGTPGVSVPHGTIYRPNSNEIWEAMSRDQQIKVIDTTSDTVIHTYSVTGQPDVTAFSPDGSVFYVSVTGGEILTLNANTGATTGSISQSVNTSLGQMVLNTDGSRLYASLVGGNVVDVINTNTLTRIASVAVGTGPWGLTLNADDSRLYVANPNLLGGLNGTTVSVIDTSNNTVVDTITTAGGPFFIYAAPTESSSTTINTVGTTSSSSSNSSSSASSGESSKPNCDAEGGLTAPDLFQVDIKGTDATLHMKLPTGNFNKLFVAYGAKANAEGYGVEYAQGKAPGAVTYTIKGLRPNTTYYFKVRAGNGCRPGPWSPSVVVKTKTLKNAELSLFHPDWVLGLWNKISVKIAQVFSKKPSLQKKPVPQNKPSFQKKQSPQKKPSFQKMTDLLEYFL